MAKKSPTQRAARLEDVVIGMGFLLLKLKSRYGEDFGVGMAEQVDQAIREYRQVEHAVIQRRKAQQKEA